MGLEISVLHRSSQTAPRSEHVSGIGALVGVFLGMRLRGLCLCLDVLALLPVVAHCGYLSYVLFNYDAFFTADFELDADGQTTSA